MKDSLVKLTTLLKIVVICLAVLGIYNLGQSNERQAKRDYYENMKQSTIVAHKKEWMSKINDSTSKLVFDKLVKTINTF